MVTLWPLARSNAGMIASNAGRTLAWQSVMISAAVAGVPAITALKKATIAADTIFDHLIIASKFIMICSIGRGCDVRATSIQNGQGRMFSAGRRHDHCR